MFSRRRSDHVIATVARIAGGVSLALAGALLVKELPNIIRYVKMERM